MAKETEELEQGSEEQGPPRSRASGEVSKASKAIIDASSKKKDATAIVSKGLNIVKSPSKSDNEQIKARALGGLCKMAEACRGYLINPGKRSDPKIGAAEGPALPRLGHRREEEAGV